MQRDYQGSIVAISDASGAVLEKRIFDAWGAIAKVEDGAGNVLAGLTILDRGYTGHEHLQSVGLIHMNGRLYDAKLHRFLQPDNYVQDLFNTQNYNRYGYCWNNPLKYSDPSGEFTWSDLVATAAIVAGLVVVIASGGTLTPVAQYLVGAGVSHFLGTFAIYSSNKVGGWDAASNYVGIQSPSISINTGWGDSKSDKNGITQNVPVVKPIATDDVRNMSADNGNTESNFSLLGAYQWYIKHTTLNFKADIGFDFLRFKGYHYGVPEFESSWLTGGAVTPGSFVLYPTEGSSLKTYSNHEPGHVLEYRFLGRYYYPLIAAPSAIYSYFHTPKEASQFYTEKLANTLWYLYTGEHDKTNPRYFYD